MNNLPAHGADYLIGRLRIVLEDAVTRHPADPALADALDAIHAYEAGEAEALAAVQDAFAAHEAQRDTPPPADDWPLPAVEIEEAEAAGLVVRPESPANERYCRLCGATTGLRMVFAGPGYIVHHYECRNGCQGGTR